MSKINKKMFASGKMDWETPQELFDKMNNPNGCNGVNCPLVKLPFDGCRSDACPWKTTQPFSDWVNVVRCKYCKYWNNGYCTAFIASEMRENDFCSLGEMKTNMLADMRGEKDEH